MTSKERMRLAMSHHGPDRVPVMCQLAIGHYLLNTGIPPAELWHSSEAFAQALIDRQRAYRFDGILINLPGRRPDWQYGMKRIEDTKEGQVIYWDNGDMSVCPWDDNVIHLRYDPATGRHIRDKELRPALQEIDPEKIFYDDPHTECGLKYPFYYGPDPYEPDFDHYFPEWHFRTIDLVLREVGDTVSVHGEFFSPFTQFLELLGYENALMALIDDPDKCKAILQRYATGSMAYGKAQAARGVDALIQSSAFAGAGFISQAYYEEFVLPYEKMAVEGIKREFPEVKIYTHTCGAIGDRLELMAESGIDGIDTLDPPPLGTVDLEDAKKRIGHRLFIRGNIDPVNTLLKGTVEQVREDAKYRVQVGKPGGGYILSSACSVAPRVAPEKLKVLVEVAEAYGRYE